MALVEQEKKQKYPDLVVILLSDDEVLSDDEDDDHDYDYREYVGHRPMTDKEFKEYQKQVSASKGFDVEGFGGILPGGISPVGLDGSQKDIMVNLSTEALKDYNRDNTANFEFHELVKATSQCVQGTMYYITFDALSSSGTSQRFRVKVWHKLCNEGFEVQFIEMI